MRILVVADPMIPIPPVWYGGTERMVALLCEELAQSGHTVRLLAAAGSRDYGEGVIVHQAPTLARPSRIFRKLWFQWLLWRASRGMEVVINVGRLDYLHALYLTAKPLVVWFHNPVRQGEIDFLNRHRQRKRCLGFISRHQGQRLTEVGNRVIVPNAVDTAFFGYAATPATPAYVVFLGRLTANKGVHLAMAAARAAGLPLKLAGNVSTEPGGREYFEQQVKPGLGPDCEWVGEVDDGQKRALLQGATALLFPIQWDEPFGLVMIESLACGTPVIAMRRASTPEVIADGSTGFLCDTQDDLIAALGKVAGLSRAVCRRSAEEQFSPPRLLANILCAVDLARAERPTP